MCNKLSSNKPINRFTLKCIAVTSMLIDHIGVILIPYNYSTPFRIIGRLAFPLFCFLLVEGLYHTRSIKKYLLRIMALAIISEPIFDKAFYNSYFYIETQSALFALLIGLLTITALNKINQKYNKLSNKDYGQYIKIMILNILAFFASSLIVTLINPEFGILGLAMILLFYYVRLIPKTPIFIGLLVINILYFEWIQVFASLAAILIFHYNGKSGRKLNYLFYSFYPLHLVILILISTNMGLFIPKEQTMHFVKNNIISVDSITSVKVKNIINISTTVEDGTFYISPFLLDANTMAVFVAEEENAWKLQEGDKFHLSFSLKRNNQEEILLGMIVNGMYNDLIPVQNDMFEITIDAFQSGEYYFTIICKADQAVTIEKGEIIVNPLS